MDQVGISKKRNKPNQRKPLNYKELTILYFLFRNSYVSKKQGASANEIREAVNMQVMQNALAEGASQEEIKPLIQPREIYKILKNLVANEYVGYALKEVRSKAHYITPLGIKVFNEFWNGSEEHYVEFSSAVQEYQAEWGDKMERMLENIFAKEEGINAQAVNPHLATQALNSQPIKR